MSSSAPPPAPATDRGDRLLIVTADPPLLDDLLRLTAAAGAQVEVAPDAGAARPAWTRAPLVLLGADVAAEVAARGLARRAGVVLVGRDLDDAAVWERAVGVGAEHVTFVPDGEAWLAARLVEVLARTAPEAPTVCVVGGRGGAGASTLAAALGVTAAARGLRCLLVDADPLGGGADLVLGGEDTAGVRWPELATTRGRIDGATLRDALPCPRERLTLLSWDRGEVLDVAPEAMTAVLAAGRRSCDLVVVDLARRVEAAGTRALAQPGVTLLVVPAEIRATASAGRVAVGVGAVASDVRVVVRGPAPSGLTGELVAAGLGLPLAGFLRAEPGLAAALERGLPPARRGRGPLAAFCGSFLDGLTGREAAA